MRKKKAIIIFKAIISYNFDKDLEEIIKDVSPQTVAIMRDNITNAKVERFRELRSKRKIKPSPKKQRNG